MLPGAAKTLTLVESYVTSSRSFKAGGTIETITAGCQLLPHTENVTAGQDREAAATDND